MPELSSPFDNKVTRIIRNTPSSSIAASCSTAPPPSSTRFACSTISNRPSVPVPDSTTVTTLDDELNATDAVSHNTTPAGLHSSDGVALDPLSSPVAVDHPPMSKRRAKRLRQKSVRLHAFTVEQASRTLLSFVGSVHSCPARILIDCGAEGNVIASSFVKKHSIPRNKGPSVPVFLPDGSSTISSHSATVSIHRDTYNDTIDALVYPLDKYDLILGKPWLTSTNPLINFRNNDLHFTHNGVPVLWQCRGANSRSISTRTNGRLLSHIHFQSLATQPGNSVFLALLKTTSPTPATGQTAPPDPPLDPAIHKIIHEEFPDVFPSSLPSGLPPDRGDAMKIETDPNADPPFRPVIRLSIAELDELRKQLDDLLSKGFIKPSTSPYGAPVLFVKKKDGTLRMCVDYRGLNRITRKNRHPLPRIDELIDRFRGARYFTKLDLLSGYHQQRIAEEDTHKTAFRCRYGHFEFNVVPFGLTNAPASFSNMMIRVLDPVLDRWVVIYLDDILIYSRTKEEHLQHIRSVLALLRKHGLYVKLKKCSFMQEQTEFLGHVISKDGVHTNAGLVRAIREWPRPKKQRDVQQFVGLAQFYHQYINNFASIALPLTALLGEGVLFIWAEEQEIAFVTLKKAISTAPVLRIFDPRHATTVETDASGFAIGAVLFQTDEYGVSRPVAFTSRKLNAAERNYPTHEQELLAVVHALKTWRYYLDGSHFIVYTDHATLQHFPTQPKLTRRQARWMELLQEYNFTFKYKKGSDNVVPDALSRRPDHRDIELNQLTVHLDSRLRQRLIDGYLEDTRLKPIYESCLQGSSTTKFCLVDGVLCTTRKNVLVVCIPTNSDLRLSLLHDAHDSAIAGHFGFEKTYDALRSRFFWPSMAKDARRYVQTCEACQRNKPSNLPPAGLLQPLPIPDRPWHTVTMDFIGPLPKTPRGYDCITVFVDKLTKLVHFAPSHSTDTASQVARIFFDHVFRLHGMPTTIVSDRDAKFTSHFWKELHRLLDVKLAMSTAFHPQTDGQTERANRTLITMLRAFVDQRQTNWDICLSAAEFATNNATNASTGVSPFFLNTGQHPVLPMSLLTPAPGPLPAVNDFVRTQSEALILAKESLATAQDRQAAQADNHRRDHDFKIGDRVLLNLENITLPADRTRTSQKLLARFAGPHTIVEQLSPVSFRLDLPATMKIHPVFHVDRLRPYHPSPSTFGERTPPRPAPVIVEEEEEYEVEGIAAHQRRHNRMEYLVQWKGYPREEWSWQPEKDLTHCKGILNKYKKIHNIRP